MDRGVTDDLRDMLFKLPGGTGENLTREMQGVDDIRTRAQQGDPSTMSPQELHAALWKVLVFRDNVVKGIESTIERIPGLSSLVEKLTDSINRFIFVGQLYHVYCVSVLTSLPTDDREYFLARGARLQIGPACDVAEMGLLFL